MFFSTDLAPNVLIHPTIASDVILNPNILREYIALMVNDVLTLINTILETRDHVQPCVQVNYKIVELGMLY